MSMFGGIDASASGLTAERLRMDVISNNLANVDTTGFKKNRVDFQDLMYQTKAVPGSPNGEGVQMPTGIQVGNGTTAIGTQKVFTSGELITSDNELDMAIEGKGFFQVLLPDGSLSYTKNGAFSKTSTGQVVTSDGYFLEPAITIPEGYSEISIGTDGTVSVTQGENNEIVEIGQIELATFVNQAGLIATGRNLYKPSAASGDAQLGNPGDAGFGTIRQKALETSNVKVVEEMVKMITAQRAYEVNTKSIQTADSMLQLANNLKR